MNELFLVARIFHAALKSNQRRHRKQSELLSEQRAINHASHGSFSALTFWSIERIFASSRGGYNLPSCYTGSTYTNQEMILSTCECSLIFHDLSSMIVLCCFIMSVTCMMFDNKHLYIMSDSSEPVCPIRENITSALLAPETNVLALTAFSRSDQGKHFSSRETGGFR